MRFARPLPHFSAVSDNSAVRKALIASIAIALVLLTIGYRILTLGGPLGGFENDQFVTLSQAQQIVLGDWPLRDFIELGMPLTVLLSAAGQMAFGGTLFAEALTASALLGICTALLFLLAWRASGSITVALLIALLQAAMAPRFYNFPKLLAYGIAMLALWWYMENPTRRRLASVAAAGAIAFLLRHDHGVYVGIGATVAVALAQRGNLRSIARDLAVLGGLALAFVAPYLLYIQLHGGLVPYVEAFVRYANQTAVRTTSNNVRMSFDWSQPLVTRVPAPAPAPRINVRWSRSITGDEREEHARSLGLSQPEPRSDDVINYAVDDPSTAHLARIVHDAAVADTEGVDRERFVLNDPRYTDTPTRGERAAAYARSIRVLPGILRSDNAVPFLYYLLQGVAFAALLMAIYRRDWPMVVIAVLAVLVDRGFLRGNLASRLADVSEVAGVLAAWLVALALRRTSGRARTTAIAAAIIVFVLASLSVEAIEQVSAQIVQTRVTHGIGSVRALASSIHELLSATPPVAAWPEDTPGMERLARYLNACTAPDDRVLTLGYIPEVFFLSQRRFAAGSVWIQPRFFTTDADQRLMIERVTRYTVPLVITVPEPEYTTEYVRSFPLLTSFLQSNYREDGTIDFGRGFRFRVLSRRTLTPAGAFAFNQLPCFS